MLTLLETAKDIAAAQLALEATIRKDLPGRAVKSIGYPGGNISGARLQTDGRFWFLSSDFNNADTPSPRKTNWFGLLEDSSSLDITVEVNTLYRGRGKRVAGFFARDAETGVVYLFHSGRVGGGTKGVGKAAFLAWSQCRLTRVVDSTGKVREGVLVMPVSGKAATRSALRYVQTIADFKVAVRQGEMETPAFKRRLKEWSDYYAESSGRRKGKRSSTFDYISRHGDVVDALKDWRLSQGLPKGARLAKSVLIDLGVSHKRELTEIFEVKTSALRASVYGAIGQLMVHGTTEQCRRTIVLPAGERIAEDIKATFKRLNIELLRFTLDRDKATIVY